MRKTILALTLLAFVATSAFAAGPGRYMHWGRQYAAAADLPACTGANAWRVAFALAEGTVHICNGSAWVDITVTGGAPTFTAAVIDNITINGNTIGSTDTNGNVKLDPNGTGKIDASGANLINVGAINNTGADSFDILTGSGTVSITSTTGPVLLEAGSSMDLTAPLGVSVYGRLVEIVQTLTVADSGDGSPAAGTLTPTRSLVNCTCSDTDGCAITLSETGAIAGQVLEVFGGSANVCTFADSAGVQELSGSLSLGANDVVSFRYLGSTWAQATAVVNN